MIWSRRPERFGPLVVHWPYEPGKPAAKRGGAQCAGCAGPAGGALRVGPVPPAAARRVQPAFTLPVSAPALRVDRVAQPAAVRTALPERPEKSLLRLAGPGPGADLA